MPYKSYKALVTKLLHPSPHPNIGHHPSQDPHGLLLLQLQLQRLRYKSLRARFSSTFSLQRALTRMQPRMERLGNLWGESKLRAQHKLQELVQPQSCTVVQPHAPPPHVTSALPGPTSPQDRPCQDQNADASTSTFVVHKEDAMFGHDGLLRHVLLKSVASLSSVFMQLWNTTEVAGRENIEAALKRPRDQGLVTVCNHVAAMDDPLVMASLVPSHYFDQPSSLRWTLCATDRCFKYAGLSELFTAMKVLPVQRGAGMKQPGLAAAESRVAAGDWVHLFPEGTRSRTPSRMGPIRKGVGRLVAAAAQQAAQQGGKPPLVVPFVHAGMEEVMPVGRLLPCTGQTVKVVVGKPIAMDDLLEAAQMNAWSEDTLYTAIANRVQARMHAMHASLHAQEAELVTGQQSETETTALPPGPLPAFPWVLPELTSLHDQALSSPLFATPAQGLLGASLTQASGLQSGGPELKVGLSSTQGMEFDWPGRRVLENSSSSSGVDQPGVQISHNSRLSQGSGSPGGGTASTEDSSSSYTWRRIEHSRLGLALKWMEGVYQGGKEQSSSGSRGTTSSHGDLCERLFYGFSLPLRHASELRL